MNDQGFLRIINEAFTPFLAEMGFSMEKPEISGRWYHIEFTGKSHSVSISFEPGDEAFFLMIYTLGHKQLSDIDDSSITPRLFDLNRRYMSTVSTKERAANEAAFEGIVVRDRQEEVLLKAAKELRLVLPKHLADCH